MVLLENEKFLIELTRLFQSTKEGGSLNITQKRVTHKAKKMSDEDPPPTHCCLIRARTEKKKLSTVVESKDVLKFHSSLTNVLKVQATNLKRKNRSKTKKATAEGESSPRPPSSPRPVSSPRIASS